ncbi:recombinase family protein [Paraliobacillus ryukyuensis]|uniref:recombinase family protein n=1 Tax=Paraliobacillus ryukyuensis TaxID=200904 RepID=UPI0009A84F26|nr:recombinase family protein [Paraliobacillus ryukyuensis]
MIKQHNKYDVLNYIKNVGIYIRRSRGDIEEDLVKHKKVIDEFVAERKWKFVEYKEIGTGSSISERIEIKQLLKDVEEGLFDAVIVFDYDRLGRGSATDEETIQKTFRLSDTIVISMNPFELYDFNNESDEEMIDFKGFLARREYKLISKRLQMGKKIGARMGNWVFSTTPYGYDYNPELKGLVINQEESNIFRRMLDAYISGDSLNKIATDLNTDNIPSPRGKIWNGNTIKNILTNESYLGWIVSNKTSGVRDSQNPDKIKKPFKEHPRDEWIIVKNCHEPLMTEDEINEVKYILSQKTRHRSGNNVNSLSGIVKCAKCEKTLTIQKNKSSILLKKCSNCGNMGGEAYLVEDLIKHQLKMVKKVLVEKKKKQKSDNLSNNIDSQVESINTQIKKQQQAIENIEEAFEDGLYDVEKTKEKLMKRRNKISELEDQKKYLLSKKKKSNKKENKIKAIEKFYSEIDQASNPSDINKLYKTVIDKVEWLRKDKDNINVKIYFK